MFTSQWKFVGELSSSFKKGNKDKDLKNCIRGRSGGMLLIANGVLALHNHGTSSWFITSSWDQPGSVPVHRPSGRHPRQAGGQRRHSPSCAACPGGQSSTQRCWCSRSGPTQPRHRLLLAPQDEQPGAQRPHSRDAGSALRGGPSYTSKTTDAHTQTRRKHARGEAAGLRNPSQTGAGTPQRVFLCLCVCVCLYMLP